MIRNNVLIFYFHLFAVTSAVSLLFAQVGCNAIVCPTQFVTQKYCGMLREICPEIETCSPGALKSARYWSGVVFLWLLGNTQTNKTSAQNLKKISNFSFWDWCHMTHYRALLQTLSFPLRLPDLRSVIVLDSRQPGMFHFDDVMQAGDSQHKLQLQDLQKKLSFDDPINIQFTSVSSAGFVVLPWRRLWQPTHYTQFGFFHLRRKKLIWQKIYLIDLVLN